MPAPPPDYGSIPTTTAPTSTSTAHNPADIWSLDRLYGKPIVPDYTTTPGFKIDPSTGVPKSTNVATQVPGSPQTTQDLMSEISGLWSQQADYEAKHPGKPTPYEQLQKLLWQAGFFGQTSLKNVHLGQWTTQTQNAVRGALASYEQVMQTSATQLGTDGEGNPIPITDQQLADGGVPTFFGFLAQNATGADKNSGFFGPGSSGGGPTAKPLTLANTSDLIATVQKAAESALGHTLTPAQAEKFAEQFHAEQRKQYNLATGAAQGQLANASFATNPLEAPASLSTQAVQYAVGADPQGFQESQIQGYTNAFLNLFLPGGSTRENMPVDPVAAAVVAGEGNNQDTSQQQNAGGTANASSS